MGYERDNIRALSAYTPGEQPRELDVVKLNTNENPYPPSPAVLDAIRSVSAEALRRYPPPMADRFCQAAARAHGLAPEQVLATNGGDELLRLAITVFCEPAPHDPHTEGNGRARGETSGRGGASGGASGSASGGASAGASGGGGAGFRGGVGMAEPSYSLYPVLASIHDTPLLRVPLADDWSLPDDFARRLNDAGCRLAIVVNPHAPSGHMEPLQRLEALAREFQGVLLIDEAYVDFARHDALPLLEPRRGLSNVLLLRSLSKGYSLAGLRFGYGLAHPELIAALSKAKDSYNTDVLAQAAATAALEHKADAARTWAAVVRERERMTAALRQRGWEVVPSESNFILATPPADPHCSTAAGPRAAELYRSLKARGILVRYFDQDRLRDKLRITIGTPEQNDRLIGAVG